jgi:hypothetical protein
MTSCCGQNLLSMIDRDFIHPRGVRHFEANMSLAHPTTNTLDQNMSCIGTFNGTCESCHSKLFSMCFCFFSTSGWPILKSIKDHTFIINKAVEKHTNHLLTQQSARSDVDEIQSSSQITKRSKEQKQNRSWWLHLPCMPPS